MRYLIPVSMGISLLLIMYLHGAAITTPLFGGIRALLGDQLLYSY